MPSSQDIGRAKDDSTIQELEETKMPEAKCESNLTGAALDEDEEFTRPQQRKIIHKIDRRLVTALGMLFAISLLDRSNFGSAAIAGMSVELDLGVGTRFSLVLLIFFGPYVLLQLPSAWLVRTLGPKMFLPGITILWGIMTLCLGFVQSWTGLIPLRMIIGAFEAGLFPGAIYLLSLWYSRYDVHVRYSWFYIISSIGSSLSGILGYIFMQVGYRGHLAPWRWIFVLEGILTVVLGVIGYLLLVDFPQQAYSKNHFLTQREAAFIIRRLQKDRADAGELEPFKLRSFMASGKDFKLWVYGLLWFCTTVVAYAIQFFLPIILRSRLKFTLANAQLLTCPPYVLGGLMMWLEGWLGDKYHIRSPWIFFNSVIAIIGLALLGWVESPGVKYFGVFLLTAGCNATVPTVLAWLANNIRGQWKRAMSSAILLSFGGIGGVAGALVFRSQDAPEYFPGLWACIACNLLAMCLTAGMVVYFAACNRRVKAGQMVIEKLEGFQYTL